MGQKKFLQESHHTTLTDAVRVRIVGEDPLPVVADRVDDVGPLDARLEGEALGALEGDVVELGWGPIR